MIGFSFSFSSNKSFLFKNNITEVLMNHRLLSIDPNNLSASSIRFYNRIISVCKQWVHYGEMFMVPPPTYANTV